MLKCTANSGFPNMSPFEIHTSLLNLQCKMNESDYFLSTYVQNQEMINSSIFKYCKF